MKYQKIPKDFKCAAWAFTLRPIDGWKYEDTEILLRQLEKGYIKGYGNRKTIGYYAVTEKEDNKCHSHGVIFLSHESSYASFRQQFTRWFSYVWAKRDQETIDSVAICIRNCYSDGWVSNYLVKDTDNDMVMLGERTVKEEDRMSRYKSLPPITRKRVAQASDAYFAKLQRLYVEWKGNHMITTLLSFAFLHYAMYDAKVIRVLTSLNRQRQVAHALVPYVSKASQYEEPYDGKGLSGVTPSDNWADARRDNMLQAGIVDSLIQNARKKRRLIIGTLEIN